MADYLVGGGGDPYADPVEALADIPSTKTEDHNVLIDMASEYVFAGDGVTLLDLTGFSGSFYITIRPKTGHSLRENIDRDTDDLAYNPSLGAAIRFTGAYSFLLSGNATYWRVIDMQLKQDAASSVVFGVDSGGASNFLIDRCFIDTNRSGNLYGVTLYTGSGASYVQRTYIYMRGSDGRPLRVGGNVIGRFCAVVRNSEHSAANTAFSNYYGGNIQNCVEVGFATAATASGWGANCWNNASALSSGLPGSNNIHSISDPFVDRDKDTLDLFLISDSDLDGVGLADAGIDEDFFGTELEDPPNIGPDEGAVGGDGYDHTASDAEADSGDHSWTLNASHTAESVGASAGAHAWTLTHAHTAESVDATSGTHDVGQGYEHTATDAAATTGTHSWALSYVHSAGLAEATAPAHTQASSHTHAAQSASANPGSHTWAIQHNHSAGQVDATPGVHDAGQGYEHTATDANATAGDHSWSLSHIHSAGQAQAQSGAHTWLWSMVHAATLVEATLGGYAWVLTHAHIGLQVEATPGTHELPDTGNFDHTAGSVGAYPASHSWEIQHAHSAETVEATAGTHSFAFGSGIQPELVRVSSPYTSNLRVTSGYTPIVRMTAPYDEA